MIEYREIERQASAVLKRAGITEPPVDVATVAEALGIVLVRDPFPASVSGVLLMEPRQTPIIGVNTTEPRTRQRFTTAHEIAHFVRHSAQRVHYDGPENIKFRLNSGEQKDDLQEKEANAFAASLLMPRAFLENDFTWLEDDEITAKTLARRYGVSEVAMTWRLMNLGLSGGG